MLRRLLIFLFYGLFTLVVVVVCLVLLFPRDKFLGWASSYLEQKIPGVEVSMGDIKYVHPLKLRLYELSLADDQKEWELPVDTLLVSVEPRFPIDHIGVVGVLFGGDLRFDLGLDSNKRLELRHLQVSEFLLTELKLIEQTMARPVQGIASLSGRATLDPRRPSDLRFIGSLQIREFVAPLKRPVLDETEVRFDLVSADIVINGPVVDFTGGSAAGPLFAGGFSGQIYGASPLGRSRLDFRGDLTPQPPLLEKHPTLAEPLRAYFNRYGREYIPYRIEGTFAEPLFSFDNLD